MFPLVFPRDDVVRPVFLVGSDEVRVIDRGEGSAHLFHQGSDLALEVIVEHLGTGHSLVHRHARDVPAAETEVVRVDHGEHVVDGNIDILAGLGVGTDPDRGGPDEGSDIVGLDGAELGGPGDVMLVGEDGSGDGRTVVTTDTDQHQTGARIKRVSSKARPIDVTGRIF